MHDKSAKSVCLGQQKTLCIILFSPEEPPKETLDEMKELKKEYENKSRLNFKFVWLNSSKHPEWV